MKKIQIVIVDSSGVSNRLELPKVQGGPVRVKAQKNARHTVVIDGVTQTGAERVDERPVQLKRNGDDLILVNDQGEQLLVIEEFYDESRGAILNGNNWSISNVEGTSYVNDGADTTTVVGVIAAEEPFVFPWWAALGGAAVGAAAIASSNKSNPAPTPTPTPTPSPLTGALSASSDTSVRDYATSTKAPVLTGVAEAGSTVSVTLMLDTDGDGKGDTPLTYQTVADASGNWSVDLSSDKPVGGVLSASGLPDGSYTPELKAVNAAGQTVTATGTAFSIDQTAPGLVGGGAGVNGDQTLVNDATPPISGQAEPGAVITVALDLDNNGTIDVTFQTTADASGKWSVDTGTATPISGAMPPNGQLPEGVVLTPVLTATDAVGNVTGPVNGLPFTVDMTAPAAPAGGAGPNGNSTLVNDTTPVLNGQAEANSTVTVALDTDGDGKPDLTYTTVADASGNWTLDTGVATPTSGTMPAAGLPTTGTITPYITSTDAAGNVSPTTTGVAFTVDNTGVTATIAMSDLALKSGDTSTVTITFSKAVVGFDNSDVSAPNGTLSNFISADGGITWTATYTPNAGVQDATNVISLGAGYADLAGNPGTQANSPNFVIDTQVTAPAAAPVLVDNVGTVTGNFTGGGTDDATPSLRVAAPAADETLVLYVDGVAVAASHDPLTGLLTPTTPLSAGPHTLSYGYKDTAGNTSALSPAVSVAIVSEYTITADAPSVTEGNSGYASAVFTVARTAGSGQGIVVVDFSSATATSADYILNPQTIIFADGETSKKVNLPIIGDTLAEANAVITATISPTTGSATNPSAAVTVIDDDQINWSISLASQTANEGASLNYVVSRTGGTDATTVVVTQSGGTALAVDHNFVNQTLTFAAGQMSQSVVVAAQSDVLFEGDETLALSIAPALGNIAIGSAEGTIIDTNLMEWSIASVTASVLESDASASFKVSRSATTATATTVVVNLVSASATASDYSATGFPKTLTFAPAELEKTVVVPVVQDILLEGMETYTAMISNPSVGGIKTADAPMSIIDDEKDTWSITVPSYTGVAPDDVNAQTTVEGFASMPFVVKRVGNALSAATVVVEATGITATSGVDFVSFRETVSFAIGEKSKTVNVVVVQDNRSEMPETFDVRITSVSDGIVGELSTARGTILDDEMVVWGVTSLNTAGYDESAGFAVFEVTRQGVTYDTGTIVFSTGGGSAIGEVGAGQDYVTITRTLTFAPGVEKMNVSIALTEDAVLEANETFMASLSSVPGDTRAMTLSPGIAWATIIDNDQSTWSVDADPLTQTSPEAGGVSAFNITRSGKTDVVATIVYNTVSGSATQGSDFETKTGTLTFLAGEASKQVLVNNINDALLEGGEVYQLQISSQSSGVISKSFDTASVIDDDTTTWSVEAQGDVSESAKLMYFNVSREGGVDATATIVINAIGVTATAGPDFTPFKQTLTFAPNEVNRAVSVDILDDLTPENLESIRLIISDPSPSALVKGTGFATANIIDNEQAIWQVQSTGTTVDEGAKAMAFSITRTSADVTSTIVYKTAQGTATGDMDFVNVLLTTLTFGQGEAQKNVSVVVSEDSIIEGDETVILRIQEPGSGVINTETATQTIIDNDGATWGIYTSADKLTSITYAEDTDLAPLVVMREGKIDTVATVVVRTAGGTAQEGQDYAALLTTLTFAVGESTKTINLDLLPDFDPEALETVLVRIENYPSTDSLSNVQAVVNLIDNDQAVWWISSNNDASEASGLASWRVYRTGSIGGEATVVVQTIQGSSTTAVDYTPVLQTLSFAAGENSKTVFATVANDTVLDPNETMAMTIRDASTGTLGSVGYNVGTYTNGTVINTIADNDGCYWSIDGSASVLESIGTATYTVSRKGDISQTATIVVDASGYVASTSFGAATGGGVDYSFTKTTLTFAANESSKVVNLAITDDAVADPAESLILTLSNASVGYATKDNQTVTTVDTSSLVWGQTEGVAYEGGVGQVTVVRQGDLSTTETIVYNIQATQGESQAWRAPTAGADYALSVLTRTLTFGVGEWKKVITYDVTEDNIPEVYEVYQSFLSSPSKGVLIPLGTNIRGLDGVLYYPNNGLGIIDNDSMLWGMQSNGGSTDSVSTTVREDSAGFAWTVYRSTADVAATIVAHVNVGDQLTGIAYTADYLLDAGWTLDPNVAGAYVKTLSFAVGELAKNLVVDLVNDSTPEFNEALNVWISDASAGLLSNTAHLSKSNQVVVQDDDRTLWSVANNGTAVVEGDTAYFSITRAGKVDDTATIVYYTADGNIATAVSNATAGADYTAVTGATLTFAPGQTAFTVGVNTTQDTVEEASETFNLLIAQNSTGVITGAPLAARLIAGSDAATNTPLLTSMTYNIVLWNKSSNVAESTATFQVTRVGDQTQASTVVFSTGGTASAGTDYTAMTQTLTFAANQSNMFVDVPLVNNDGVAENIETLTGTLSAPSLGIITTTSANYNIRDDVRSHYQIFVFSSINEDGSYLAGSPALSPHAFEVVRTGNLAVTTTVVVNTTGGTATAGVDYTAIVNQTLTFAPGESGKRVDIGIINDSLAEANETIIATLSAPDNGGELFTPSVTMTLQSNDDAYTSATAGADTIAVGTDGVGYLVNALAGNDTLTFGAAAVSFANVQAGDGNDLLSFTSTTAVPQLITPGSVVDGGNGVDTLSLATTGMTVGFNGAVAGFTRGMEIIDLTGTGNNTLNLSQAAAVAITQGDDGSNNVLRIDGNAGDVVNLYNFGPAGALLSTPAAGTTVTDASGTTGTVVASAAGSATANDVVIGAQTYDVYQFASSAGTFTLLIDTDVTKNFVL